MDRNGKRLIKKIPCRIVRGKAREAQYRVIEKYRGRYKIVDMCEFFLLSRAAYYAWRKRRKNSDPNLSRKKLIIEAYMASRKTYGYRRIQMWIEQKKGITINHKAVLRLMNELDIHSVARRRKPYKKWAKETQHYRFPNHLNQDFTADTPNQKWVTDITYIPTKLGWAYLSTIKDLFDGFIVAHYLTKRNSVELVTKTLQLALDKEKVTGTLLHSDQGHQYCSHAYYVLSKAYKMTPSMSRRGNCLDNAVMENFFGHLKEEAIRQYPLLSFHEIKQVIDEYIYFYNYERLQLNTKQTPYQLRCLSS